MTDKASSCRMTVTEVDEFLRKPPAGFSVEDLDPGCRVLGDPEKSLVLIEDFDSCRGRIVFENSLGRKVVMRNLCEYTDVRRSLLSKRIYLLMSACWESASAASGKAATGAGGARALERYVVSIDGSDPLIKWQMEKGLDWTISSVTGESYRVDIDLTETMESWAAKNIHITSSKPVKVEPVWRDASFTLKYYSDALFDFPHWFGFSKRNFKMNGCNASLPDEGPSLPPETAATTLSLLLGQYVSSVEWLEADRD